MSPVQQSSDNPLIPSDRDFFLFGNGYSAFCRRHDPAVRPIQSGNFASAGNTSSVFRMISALSATSSSGHAVRPHNQIRVLPVLHVFHLFVFGGVRGRNRLPGVACGTEI